MSCGICPQSTEIINTIDNPVVTTIAPAAAATAERLYFSTTQNQTVINAGSLFLQITNPAGSGRNLHIARILGTANTNTVITLNRNGLIPVGIVLTPINANFGSVETSVATIHFLNQVADPTVGGTIFQHYFQPVTGGFVVPEYDGRIVMPPGTTLVIRLLNNQAGNNQLSLSIGFWETEIL